jgi:hypothetical protein
MELRYYLYISHVSLDDDGLSGAKHFVSGIIKAFVCLTHPSIFICTISSAILRRAWVFCPQENLEDHANISRGSIALLPVAVTQ